MDMSAPESSNLTPFTTTLPFIMIPPETIRVPGIGSLSVPPLLLLPPPVRLLSKLPPPPQAFSNASSESKMKF
jgi:hypothetical protein